MKQLILLYRQDWFIELGVRSAPKSMSPNVVLQASFNNLELFIGKFTT